MASVANPGAAFADCGIGISWFSCKGHTGANRGAQVNDDFPSGSDAAAVEGLGGGDADGALGAERQKARFAGAGGDRVAELHEVDALGADDGGELVERGVGVVGDADVAELLLRLPGAQGGEMGAPV